MTKLILTVFTFFFAVNLLAATRSHFAFTGEQVIITMSSQDLLGNHDEGPQQLYGDLNLPIEKSFLGEGKVLKDKDGAMTFIVVDRGNNRFEVSIVLKKNTNIVIDPVSKYAAVRFSGVTAQYLFGKWRVRDSRYEFTNQDGNLKIFADPDIFLLTFQ
jgi:hypothetical protein